MTTKPPKSSPPRSSPRWMRIALGLSLALNLAVAGVVGGVALRWGGGPEGRPAHFSTSMPGDLSFRAAISALPDADRQALRREMRDTRPDRNAAVVPSDGPDAAGIMAALRAPTFDPDVILRALGAPVARAQSFAGQGHIQLVARIAAMTRAERQAYADRLDAELAKRAARQRKGR